MVGTSCQQLVDYILREQYSISHQSSTQLSATKKQNEALPFPKTQYILGDHKYLIKKQTMKEVYLLIPLLISPDTTVEPNIQKILNISPTQYQLYQFDDQKYAVQLLSQNLGYQQLTYILQENQQMRAKLSVIQNSLKDYQWSSRESNSLLKKAMKYKQIKDENKQLRRTLQKQLQNAEKVQEETQKSMRVLRQEFDTLVTEINNQIQSRSVQKPLPLTSRTSQKQHKNEHQNHHQNEHKNEHQNEHKTVVF